ncbi:MULTISPECIES: protein-methionine-sulfoxide reductase heme-binding subunit MsrQ [Methylomonas]|uniref:sulfite oxidase heme-binding subunit YedZ n=1 Tax=Methylomonas TaxID=416 RepID=UPI001232404F|nr:protein-methionine-sulfoxide reductase heme-binding subunit MsrQ [Methylomonas rhizoryzae]
MSLKLDNIRIPVALCCLLPLFWLLLDILLDRLGGNPIQAITIRLGDWALRFICITLAITPVQTITNWRGMADFRQMFGMYAFFYASLHLLAYLFVDHAAAWHTIYVDIIESIYLWMGVIAYFVILLLAVTSPNSAKKRLGKNWKKLHRFIYYAAIIAVTHYIWQLKGNLIQPLVYLILVILLLVFRMMVWLKSRQLSKLMLPRGKSVHLDQSD